MHTEDDHVKTREGSHPQATEGLSEETNPADTMILDSEPLELRVNTVTLFKSLSLSYLIMAALAN